MHICACGRFGRSDRRACPRAPARLGLRMRWHASPLFVRKAPAFDGGANQHLSGQGSLAWQGCRRSVAPLSPRMRFPPSPPRALPSWWLRPNWGFALRMGRRGSARSGSGAGRAGAALLLSAAHAEPVGATSRAHTLSQGLVQDPGPHRLAGPVCREAPCRMEREQTKSLPQHKSHWRAQQQQNQKLKLQQQGQQPQLRQRREPEQAQELESAEVPSDSDEDTARRGSVRPCGVILCGRCPRPV